jgi:hypothetical protein
MPPLFDALPQSESSLPVIGQAELRIMIRKNNTNEW